MCTVESWWTLTPQRCQLSLTLHIGRFWMGYLRFYCLPFYRLDIHKLLLLEHVRQTQAILPRAKARKIYQFSLLPRGPTEQSRFSFFLLGLWSLPGHILTCIWLPRLWFRLSFGVTHWPEGKTRWGGASFYFCSPFGRCCAHMSGLVASRSGSQSQTQGSPLHLHNMIPQAPRSHRGIFLNLWPIFCYLKITIDAVQIIHRFGLWFQSHCL